MNVVFQREQGVASAVLGTREGYDLAASAFAGWHWTKFWRRYEAPIVQEWLRTLAPGLGLDAGTGLGPYLEDAVGAGHRCVAVDVSAGMLRMGAHPNLRRHPGRLAWRVQGDIQALPLAAGRLDWVLATRVLSNNADPARILTQFAHAMRKDANCLLADVHPDHPYERMTVATGAGVLTIRTYRHALSRIAQVASRSFEVITLAEYRLADLSRQPRKDLFAKIYDNPEAPIFYVTTLRRT